MCAAVLRVGSQPFDLRIGATVIIAPHQDDETLACGGVISRKRDEGLPVHVIFITDGSASHPNHPRLDGRAISVLRRQEAMRALACLRVERVAVHFLDQPDGQLHRLSQAEHATLISQLSLLFRAIEPSEVFVPTRPDGSSEHDAVFGFVAEAIAASGLEPVVWQYPVWSWWNPLLLVRRWISCADCRRLPLEDHAQAKLDAIECYQSQVAPLEPGTQPALPRALVRLFQADAEYFFRDPPPKSAP